MAVSTTTGTSAPSGRARKLCRNANPSITGMVRSSSTTPGRAVAKRSSPSRPSAASVTAQPSRSSSVRMRARVSASSSITRTPPSGTRNRSITALNRSQRTGFST